MAGLVFDTGLLIAAERRDRRAEAWLERSLEVGVPPLVASVSVAESWRGGARSARLARTLRACEVLPADERTARLAGVLLGRAGSSATIEAIVVATAAGERADVLTADPAGVEPLAALVGVRVLTL